MSDEIVSVLAGDIGLSLRLPREGQPEILASGRGAALAGVVPAVRRASRINGMDVPAPMAVLLPTGGLGHFGWPAIAGHRDGRDFVLGFSGFSASSNGTKTVLTGRDTVARLTLEISLSGHVSGVLGSSVRLINDGDDIFTLDRCMAGNFVIEAGPATLTSFTGMWGREYQTRKTNLADGLWLQESRRGRTSHDRFPVIFTETEAETLGFHLGWSGNHSLAIETLDDGRRMIHLGELFEPGEIRLAPGEAYSSPKAYMAASVEAFHAFEREALIAWPGGRMAPRPVTLNTWEGNYFDHRMDSLKAQADSAARLGIERFVLDDGWFGRRDDDTTSLGDWFIDERKYPYGLKPLVDHVTGLGMQFGLWFEPEMVNPDSDLCRNHPDWVLQVEGRPLLLSRNQLVLDLARPEVSDYLFDRMAATLSSHAISYIKWDMNRDLTHVGGADGRARTSAQTRAVYALMARIRAVFPNVEIESCASGGGRIDFGVLEHTHRVWSSDCTDALERLEIQRGLSHFLAPELMGAHVSASPNHQTHRKLSLSFRSIVALAYHFGVELNPLTLDEAEFSELADFIALHKTLRPILHAPGSQFHLPVVDGRHVWGAAEENRAVLFVAQGPQMVGEHPAPVRIPAGRLRAGNYRIRQMKPEQPDFVRISADQTDLLTGKIAFGRDYLTRVGLTLPMLRPESAMVLIIDRAGEE